MSVPSVLIGFAIACVIVGLGLVALYLWLRAQVD